MKASPVVLEELGDFTTPSSSLRIAALAIPIGALSAMIAAFLTKLIGLFTNLFFYQRWDTSFVSPAENQLGWIVVIVPVLGGLIVGLMARYGSDRIRGHGIPEALEAILMRGSRVDPKVALLKPVSAAISIGSGGPFGAEGPIIMTGGAFGSMIAQLFRLTAAERKTLLVAGAAAGMSATFCAPLASVMLAVELLLFELKPRSFVPVALASATAMAVRGATLGNGPIFAVPAHAAFIGPTGLLASAGIGVLMGALAWLLTRSVYLAEDAFLHLPIHWMWWPALGGVIVGLGGLLEPRALGVGYDSIGALLNDALPLSSVLKLVAVKWAIWAIFLGSGTSGGVLAPLLMIGSAVGGLAGQYMPDAGHGYWSLIAMGAVLGGTMRSPLTGVIFAIELTGDRAAALPLLIASTIAHVFTVLTMRRSILTEKVARRGFHVSREYAIDPLEVLFVRDAMQSSVVGIPADANRHEVTRLLASRVGVVEPLYPVLERDAFIGVVTRRVLSDWAATTSQDGHGHVLEVVQREVVTANPEEPLTVVVRRMASSGRTRLPVLSRDPQPKLLGLISLDHMLKARQRHLEEETRRERVLRLELLLPAPFRPRVRESGAGELRP